jgi:hypothetical protein
MLHLFEIYVVDKHGKRGRREGSQKREGEAEVKEREIGRNISEFCIK